MSGSSGKRIAAEQDIVVVSFKYVLISNLPPRLRLICNCSYRTNIFGFPRNPAGTQNVGLLDQRLALEWIRDNIANFGGDTKRITIMGQSAGGTSIDYYGFAWTQDPIIAGSIVQSGTSFSFAASSVNESAVSWFNVSGELGCGGSKSNLTEVLSCMQIKDFEDIIAAVQVADAAGLGGSVLGSFGPTIDEEVVFSDYDHRARHGQFIQRPLLIGNNNYEAGFFKIVTALSGARSGISLNPPDFYWEAFQKVAFECATAHRAYYHVQAGLPVWRYRYFGEFPNLALSIVPSSGAYHGSELPMLFDMLGGLGPSTSAQLAIGREMRSAWSAFVRDPEVGLVERPVHWKPYNPEKQSLIRIAFNNATGPNYSDTALYDYICPLLTALAGNDGATSSTFSDGYVDAYAELVELDQQDVERLFQMYQT
jgi:carboxylesterase type B